MSTRSLDGSGLGTVNVPLATAMLSLYLGKIVEAQSVEDVSLIIPHLNLALDGIAGGFANAPADDAEPTVLRAREWSILAHGDAGQFRAGSGLAYASHCAEVCAVLSTVTDDPDALSAAWLHDSKEDAGLSRERLALGHGDQVANLIMAVSGPEPQGFLSRADRKARFREQLAAASAQAQSLKLADVISNARNVRINNPKFAQTYLLEKQRDVLALSRGNRSLRNAAAKLVLAELKALQSAGTA